MRKGFKKLHNVTLVSKEKIKEKKSFSLTFLRAWHICYEFAGSAIKLHICYEFAGSAIKLHICYEFAGSAIKLHICYEFVGSAMKLHICYEFAGSAMKNWELMVLKTKKLH